MARWENENTSDLNLPDRITTNINYLDKNGKDCDERNGIIKIITNNSPEGENVKYYIRYFRGELIDPHFTNFNQQVKKFTFKKVSKEIFNIYLKFLKTKNTLYFTRARRLNME